MKARTFLTIALACIGLLQAATAQQPVIKVDFDNTGRSVSESNEPGYTSWKTGKDITSESLTVEGVTFTVSSTIQMRCGGNKTLAQGKEGNARLLSDGLIFSNNQSDGSYTLTIKGLPVGNHTLQTIHNGWDNPSNRTGFPIHIAVNGESLTTVHRTYQQTATANAAIVVIPLSVKKEGEAIKLTFTTSLDDDPDDPTKSTYDVTPVLNGFEINTISVTAKAKVPNPDDGDVHVDADSGVYAISWSPANENVRTHHLYLGTDEEEVTNATAATADIYKGAFPYADTTYTVNDLYCLNTYYWRVDEEDQNGIVTPGTVWSFRPRHLAFPGAEGYGRFATGGRGGIVYHVTNLKNDHNPGSLLYGLYDLTGPRTIVFDVSGLIVMDFSSVFAKSYVTIAAQTAPGKGICLKASNLGLTDETICRFLRAKRGYGDTGNAMGLGSNHVIADHTTAAWGTDETVSGRGGKMLSFQYCMIAEALGIADHKNYEEGKNHGFAATIDGKIGSWHHNLLVNCSGRNWSMGGGMDGTNTAIGQMDLFNNVCYNWNGRTTDGGCHEVNFVNNYYKMGPDTRRTELFIQQYENVGSLQSTWQAYISGNIRENKDHTLSYDKYKDTYTYTLSNGAVDPNTRTDEYQYNTFVDKPFFPSYAEIHSAKAAFKIVTSDAGATMPCRDNQHLRVVKETVNGTYTYTGSRSGIRGEIDHEKDITGEANNGWEEWPEEHRAENFDTDQDGMPNWYEKVIGSDENVANNNDDPDHDGYTLLEDYLDFMAHPYLVMEPGASATYDVSQCFRGFTKNPEYTFEVDGNGLVTATIDGSVLTVKSLKGKGIEVITMKVKDSEGDTFEQRLSIAVCGETTGLQSVTADESGVVVKREFFTIDGKAVGRTELRSQEAYILKTTYDNGKVESVKILMD